jgi:hypothetical protein
MYVLIEGWCCRKASFLGDHAWASVSGREHQSSCGLQESEDDEDLLSDDVQGSQSTERNEGNRQVIGLVRCSYVAPIKLPKCNLLTGMDILKESYKENRESSEDGSSKPKDQQGQQAIEDSMKGVELFITEE